MVVLTTKQGHPLSGTTANRPTGVEIGERYFDTDLGQLIVWNGTGWQLVGGAAPGAATVAAGGSLITNAAPVAAGTTLVTGATLLKTVILPVGVNGMTLTLINDPTANLALKVYPQINSAINLLAANAAYNIAAKTSMSFHCLSATQWYTIPQVAS